MAIPNSEDTQFKAGQSGNPSGRPKGSKNRSTLLRKWMETESTFKHPETKRTVVGTVEDRMALGLITRAMKGDPAAFREAFDSVYGKVVDRRQDESVVKVMKTELTIRQPTHPIARGEDEITR